MHLMTKRPEPDQPLPATTKQLYVAKIIARRNHVVLPWAVQQDRRAISLWIEHQQTVAPLVQDSHPTSKQVAFAEKIARIKRRSVPDECFRDRLLLSRWIDCNR